MGEISSQPASSGLSTVTMLSVPLILLSLYPSLAHADPLPQEGAATCQVAATLLADSQPRRALLYYERCYKFEARKKDKKKITGIRSRLGKAKLAPVSLSLTPATATASIADNYKSDRLQHDEDFWLGSGSYRITVTAEGYESAVFTLQVDSSGERMLVPLTLQTSKAPTTTEIDLGNNEDGAELGTVTQAADPRPKKFKSILAKRYRRAPDPKPLPDSDPASGPSLWLPLSASAGAIAIATGVALQLQDKPRAAWIGYGTGTALLGLAAYLAFGDDDNESATTANLQLGEGVGGSVSNILGSDQFTLTIQSRW